MSDTVTNVSGHQQQDLAMPSEASFNGVRFGTDGWRAIIGKDFNTATLARVAEATAAVYRTDNPLPQAEQTSGSAGTLNTFYIGYDCRANAGRYAALAAVIIAAQGFNVRISDSYCPTPTLCWSVANDPTAVGGVMLTSSHNPAEYLGVKLRMADGGASPKEFSDRVEAALAENLEMPAAYDLALSVAERASNGSPDERASLPLVRLHNEDASLFAGGSSLTDGFSLTDVSPGSNSAFSACLSRISFVDLMTPYLSDLLTLVDAQAIQAAKLRVVVDPMYGAGRSYLASILSKLGVQVEEVNNAADPTFAGLHPEPILPWIKEGLEKTVALGFDACFVTDGDADRIGAGDAAGNFVNPHRILALLVAHLAQGKQLSGRVVRTLSGSNLVKRQCERLGLELTTTPIGFKWIYGEMLKGDVMIGGEESGGIGIPGHVRERDGLLMALLLTELMAQTKKTLGALVAELLHDLGDLSYARRDLQLSEASKEAFVRRHCQTATGAGDYAELFVPFNEQIIEVDHRDGVKLCFASDAWLLMRPSGTEPLVRVYAEAQSLERVDQLLNVGVTIVAGEVTGD